MDLTVPNLTRKKSLSEYGYSSAGAGENSSGSVAEHLLESLKTAIYEADSYAQLYIKWVSWHCLCLISQSYKPDQSERAASDFKTEQNGSSYLPFVPALTHSFLSHSHSFLPSSRVKIEEEYLKSLKGLAEKQREVDAKVDGWVKIKSTASQSNEGLISYRQLLAWSMAQL